MSAVPSLRRCAPVKPTYVSQLQQLKNRQRWDADYLARPAPFHKDCGCTNCCAWRAIRVLPGCFVQPAPTSPTQGVPFWRPGTWRLTGWGFRLGASAKAIVIGHVDYLDKDNGGHLDCVMCMFTDGLGLYVTARQWLDVL